MSGLARARAKFVVKDGTYDERLADLLLRVNDARADERNEERQKRRVGTPVVDEEPASLALSQEYDALLAESQMTYILQALPRRKWDDAKDAHPPRKVDGEIHPDDEPTGVNTRTFFDAIMHETIVDPSGDNDPDPRPKFTPKQAEEFCESLGKSDWRDLCSTVFGLNEHGAGIPTSSITSSLRRQIDTASKQQNDSASPSRVSRVGSQPSDTSTETSTDNPAA